MEILVIVTLSAVTLTKRSVEIQEERTAVTGGVVCCVLCPSVAMPSCKLS